MHEEDKFEGNVVQGFDPSALFGKGFNLDCAALIQGGSFREVVGRCVTALYLKAVDKDGLRIFKGVTIVILPVTVTNHTEESVFTSLAQAIKELRGFELEEQEEPILRRVVHVVNTPSFEVDDLLLTVRKQEKQCLVAVADASLYRDHHIDTPAAFGISAVRLNEDRWAPHVTAICRQLVPIVKELQINTMEKRARARAKKTSRTTSLRSNR